MRAALERMVERVMGRLYLWWEWLTLPLVDWQAKYRLDGRWEVKVEDLWVGAFWRVDDMGRAHLWLTLPPAGLPCLPLHLSWDTGKTREPRWTYIINQNDTIMDRRLMPLGDIVSAVREGSMEVVAGEPPLTVLGAKSVPADAAWDGGMGHLTAVVKVHDGNPPKPGGYDVEGWDSWEDVADYADRLLHPEVTL
jgi:hypothetical protein